MINQFYKVLELEPGASKSEVKKAYRRLAKRYHPDIHPGVGREKFLEISEAYNFLMEMMETGRMPSIDSGQNVSTPDRREYEEARQRAWAKAQKMANEKRRTHDLTLAKVNKVFHVLAIAVLGLNLVYIADMLLPADNSRVDNVQGLIRAYTDGSFRYDLILNKMRIEVDELEHEAYDYGVIHVSPIFHKWTHATLYHEGVPEKVRFTMIAYSPLFIFLIILLILVYGLTLRLENQSSNKLSFFLIFFFAAAIQGMLVVFYV